MARRTRLIVCLFGVFQFLWVLIAAFWTDLMTMDLIAFVIAVNGLMIRRSSFKRFPWTALMCCLYPVAFVGSMLRYDPRLISNWIPTRESPVLGMQLLASCWAIYAALMIVRCYASHRRRQVIDDGSEFA